MAQYHKTVLTEEAIYYLNPQPGGIYVDATFGGGGHTRALLAKEPKCSVIGVDWDQIALEQHAQIFEDEFGERIQFVWGNFANLRHLLKKIGVGQVDGILADFGTSQDQIFRSKGFSFATDSPLDMRMSPAHQKVTAAHVLNTLSEKELADIFFELGEERHSRKIARVIVEERKKKSFRTTEQLAKLVEAVVPKGRARIHPATRVFQALRIYVNHELENISSLLQQSLALLKPNGRLVCISFHSLEDRLVKRFFVEHPCLCGQAGFEILTKKVVVATDQEVSSNPSARSARLRAAQRC